MSLIENNCLHLYYFLSDTEYQLVNPQVNRTMYFFTWSSVTPSSTTRNPSQSSCYLFY